MTFRFDLKYIETLHKTSHFTFRFQVVAKSVEDVVPVTPHIFQPQIDKYAAPNNDYKKTPFQKTQSQQPKQFQKTP